MTNNALNLSFIYNEKSGFHSAANNKILEEMVCYWAERGFSVTQFVISNHQDFDQMMQQVLLRHADLDHPGIVVAAGGDGTLNAVAARLLHLKVPMGILPMGTFNYVARALDIPLDLMAAAEVIATGVKRAIHVAKINDQIYLNNASLGLYPLFIQKRELYNQKFGRFPLHAYTSGLDVLIREHQELKLELQIDQEIYSLETPLIFFGNNQLQLADLNLKVAECAKEGRVAGVVMAKSDKLILFKSLLQLVRGKIDAASDVHSFSAQQVIVDAEQAQLSVAIDGEIVEMTPPLKIHVEHSALNVMVPYVDSSV